MTSSAMFRYEKDALRRLLDGIIPKNIKTLLKTSAENAMKRILRAIYEAAEDTVKRAVNSRATDSAISSKRDKFVRSQQLAQNIVGCVMTATEPTAL